MRYYNIDSVDKIDQSFLEFQNKVLGKQGFTMLVQAEWCGHCKTLKPLWDGAMTKLSKNAVNVVRVDSEVMNHMKEAHPDHTFTQLLESSVSGFPTIANVHRFNGTDVHVDQFDGQRNEKEITEFVQKQKQKQPRRQRKPKTKPTKTKKPKA